MALGLGDQGLKLVLTSGVEAQSSENIDEDPLKLLVFRVERRHLHLFATSVKTNHVFTIYDNKTSPRSNN